MERLNYLKSLLSEAMKDKENNKKYIEDLLISIEYQQIQIDKMMLHKVIR